MRAPRRLRWLGIMALGAAGIMVGSAGSPSTASAAACITAAVATYTTGGFSCNVGPVTFDSIAVSTTVSGTGSVTLGNFTPITLFVGGTTEYGLSLNYAANTGATAGSHTDVAWTYNVTGVPAIVDAFLSLAGNITGTGTIAVSEVLSNGVTLSLNSAGSTTAVFAPISTLGVIKDQNNFAGSAGSATTSILQNAFSVNQVSTGPEPGTLALLGTALCSFGLLRRRRKQKG